MTLHYEPAEAIAHLSKADKKLAKLIAKAGDFDIQPDPLQSLFEGLLRTIIYQQLAGAAAATIHGRVVALLPSAKTKKPQAVLDLPEEDLRGAGLSANKLKSVRDLATKTLDGTVPKLAALRKMPDEEILQRLTSVRGIGEWTVHMLLMFQLGRPDVLPIGDYGVRKGFMLVYKTDDLPKPKQMTEHAERWRPYRSVASWYMWRAVDLHGGKMVLPKSDDQQQKSTGKKAPKKTSGKSAKTTTRKTVKKKTQAKTARGKK